MRGLLLILILFVQAARPDVAGLNADGSLDRAKISKAYFEGDFDQVVEALEAFRKLHSDPTREDRIYTYKYLSVIYAAKPETRAKAESYMYQLLKIMPSIELMDLYISDNIESIFNTVRARYEQRQRYGLDSGQGSRPAAGAVKPVQAADPSSSVSSSSASSTTSGKPGKSGEGASSWVWWTAGAVGIAAAVAGFVYLSEPVKTASAPSDTVDLE